MIFSSVRLSVACSARFAGDELMASALPLIPTVQAQLPKDFPMALAGSIFNGLPGAAGKLSD